MRISRRLFLLSSSFSGLSLACGASAPEPATVAGPAGPKPEAPPPKDAAEIAQNLVSGQVSGMLWVDRLRGHAIAPRLLTLGPVRELLEDSELDPLRDLERVFVTGPSVTGGRGVMFAHHRIPENGIERVLDDLVKKSEPRGQRLHDLPFPAVAVQKKRFAGVVAFLPRGFVVALPEDQVDRLDVFAKTGGLPDPTGPEAGHFVARDPGRTLRARGAPRVPQSISLAEARLILKDDGGLDVRATGQSTSAEQADADARELTRSIDDATSVRLGIIKLRAFRPIAFAGKGDQVVTSVRLSRAEVDQLLRLANTFA